MSLDEQLNAQETFGWGVVKIKARIGRGQAWGDYLKNIVYVVAGIRLAEDILTRFFAVPSDVFKDYYIYLPPFYFLFLYVVGWIDEKKGIWKLESVFNYRELNPYFTSFEIELKELNRKIDMLIQEKKK